MEDEIKVGDYVRNKISGNFGEVIELKKGLGSVNPFEFVRVMVMKKPMFPSLWLRKNVELVKGATK